MHTRLQPSDGALHAIIHSAGVAAAGVGAGLAQLPGSDAPILMSIQAAMIMGLASKFGVPLEEWAAADLVMTFAASMAGRGVSQVLIGWVPGFGNAINAATAASLTEAVGWSAVEFFRSGGTA